MARGRKKKVTPDSKVADKKDLEKRVKEIEDYLKSITETLNTFKQFAEEMKYHSNRLDNDNDFHGFSRRIAETCNKF